MAQLEGKIAVVTGGSHGIGLAIARALAGEGATVILVARRRAALEKAARDVPRAVTIPADVTRPADVQRLFRSLRERYGRLDILVNSAGVFTYKPFARTTLADWRRNIETNLTSIFLTTRAALPLLSAGRKRPGGQGGHVVNILSISSREAFPKCSAYTASKFGALGLTRVLAQELRGLGIRVTAVLPGSTNTRLNDEFDFRVEKAEILQPEDVAGAVLAAVLEPPRATVDEILITPSRGAL